MTEDEAFMAESALINLLKIDNLKVSKNQELTNIQNGHISKGEKKEDIPTKARSVDEFYKECAKKPIKISDIPCKVMIRNINRGYPYCINKKNVNDAVRETVRAFWREGKPDNIDYVFAAYKGRIVGVYEVVKEENQKKFYSIFDYLDNNNKVTDFPTDDSLELRKKDLEFIKKLKAYYEKNEKCDKNNKEKIDDLCRGYCKEKGDVVEGFFGKKDDYPKALKNFIHRKYYNLKDVEDEKIKDFVGRRVLKEANISLFNQRQTYVMVNKDSTSK